MTTQSAEYDCLRLFIRYFPGGFRDFEFSGISSDPRRRGAQSSLPFLFTEKAPSLLEQIEERNAELARQVFFAQLLTPCLKYQGNSRHLIVEPWDEHDLSGQTLSQGQISTFRRDLSREQADDFKLVKSGKRPPKESLAELFWDSHVTTPRLPDEFDDKQMGDMTLAIINLLNPDQDRSNVIHTSSIKKTIKDLWLENFASLQIDIKPRERRQVFKRLITVTIRLASQFNGMIAENIVQEEINKGELGDSRLSETESKLLELRYGGARVLEDVNVSLLFGCDGLYAELVNEYAESIVINDTKEVEETEKSLADYFSLLRSYRQRRKLINSHERSERRHRRQDKFPGTRLQAENQVDTTALPPGYEDEPNPIFSISNSVIAKLHPRDQARINALIEADGNREKAAQSLGIERINFSRQFQQTTMKHVRRILKQLKQEED